MNSSGSAFGVTARIYPQLAEGIRAAEAGEFERAARHIIAHLQQNPDEPQGLAQLGLVAMRLGALVQSEHFLRKAMVRGANSTEVRRHLASVLNQQDRPDQAAPMFEALAAESGDPGLRAILANVLDKLGRNAEALAMLEDLANAPKASQQVLIAYGLALRSAGKVEEAVAVYRRAIAIDDGFGEAWWGLASIKKPVFTDEDIAAMRDALEDAIDVLNIAPLNFALARALHDRGQFRDAFEHFETGNRLRAESIGYDSAELTQEVAEVEQLVDREFIEKMSTTPVGEGRPIFIVSLPRSGSTLLEQMLGSHPQIEPVGELPYVPAILRSFMEVATRRAKVTVPRAIASLSDDQAASFGKEYLRRTALHRKTDRPFFIDKLPHNWSNILFIRRILPQARFIEIRRSAMDCCFSNFSQSFSSAHASSFALRDIGQCYVDSVRLMSHFDAVAPGLIHHIGYEALVEDPATELGQVLGYLELPWDDALMSFHKLDRVVRTPSSEQVRRPLNRDGMDVWKPYSEWLGPLREVLGELAQT